MASSHLIADYANCSIYRTLLEIADNGGVLTALGVSGGNSTHYISVFIDDRQQPLVDDFLCASPLSYGNMGMGINLPFRSYLKVEIKDRVPSATPRFWAAYVLSNTEFMRDEVSSQEIQGIEYMYQSAIFETPKGKFWVQSSKGGKKISTVTLYRDSFLKGQAIAGKVELKTWEGNPLKEPVVKLNIQRPGTTLTIGDVILEQVEGKAGFEKEVPIPSGVFEILADLTGYVNIPATLVVF